MRMGRPRRGLEVRERSEVVPNANPGPPARPPGPWRDEQGQRGTDPTPAMT